MHHDLPHAIAELTQPIHDLAAAVQTWLLLILFAPALIGLLLTLIEILAMRRR